MPAQLTRPLTTCRHEITRRGLHRRQPLRVAIRRDSGERLVVILATARDMRFPCAAAGDTADRPRHLTPVGRVHLNGRAVAAIFRVTAQTDGRAPPLALRAERYESGAVIAVGIHVR